MVIKHISEGAILYKDYYYEYTYDNKEYLV